jgi:hypothetical protein
MRRLIVIAFLCFTGPALAGEARELLTGPAAVLCLDADSLDAANAGAVSKSQDRLRELGCLRSPAGVRATLLDGANGAQVWSVRYRPQGISGGITLWARPSSFTQPDGSALPMVKAER